MLGYLMRAIASLSICLFFCAGARPQEEAIGQIMGVTVRPSTPILGETVTITVNGTGVCLGASPSLLAPYQHAKITSIAQRVEQKLEEVVARAMGETKGDQAASSVGS